MIFLYKFNFWIYFKEWLRKNEINFKKSHLETMKESSESFSQAHLTVDNSRCSLLEEELKSLKNKLDSPTPAPDSKLDEQIDMQYEHLIDDMGSTQQSDEIKKKFNRYECKIQLLMQEITYLRKKLNL